MVSKELAQLARDEGIEIKELIRQYRKWEIDTGIVEKPIVTPSTNLKEILGAEDVLTEAMLSIIEKALPLLNDEKTMEKGASIITKVYDSIKGNKGGSTVSVITNSVTNVEAQKQALIEMREKQFDEVGIK